MWVVAGAVFVLAVTVFVVRAVRRDRAMHAALKEQQEWNQADTVFTSDSVARMLVAYFDHPWHSPNTRMLAHYLLGRDEAVFLQLREVVWALQRELKLNEE